VSSRHIAIVRGRTGELGVDNEPRHRLSIPSLTGVYQFGPFQLDAPERRLLRDGVQVPLRLKAFETLCMLVENAGRLVTKEALLRQVWPDAMVEENNINANVSILRKAMGEECKWPVVHRNCAPCGIPLCRTGRANIFTKIRAEYERGRSSAD